MNKIYTTLQREGLLAVFKKLFRRTLYWSKRSWNNNHRNIKRWGELKDKFKGEQVFLIGNGPSLNKTPLYLLKNEYTMCFNHFDIMRDRLNWFPDFYMATDNLVIDDLLDRIFNLANYSRMVFLPDIHFRGQNFAKTIGNYDNIYWLEQKHGQGFSENLPTVNLGGSVIYEGFQVLNYLGFKEIYFIGVDMNFKPHTSAANIKGNETDIVSQQDDDPNHFDPRYFGKDKKYHQPEDYVINFIKNNLRYLSEIMTNYHLDIKNAGYDSELECFPKTDYKDLFDYSEEEKLSLINECFQQNTKFNSLKEFSEVSVYVKTANQISENVKHFRIPVKDAVQMINDYIFTHIPIGPHNGMYYFVSRD